MLLLVIDGLRYIPAILIVDHKPDGRNFRKQHLVMKQSSSIYVSVGITASYFPIKSIKLPLNLLNPTGHVMHQQFNIQQL